VDYLLKNTKFLVISLGILLCIPITLVAAFAWFNPVTLNGNWVVPPSVTNIEFATNNTAIITLHNTWTGNITIVSATINGSQATLAPTGKQASTIPKDCSTNFVVILKNNNSFNLWDIYEFRFFSSNGCYSEYLVSYSGIQTKAFGFDTAVFNKADQTLLLDVQSYSNESIDFSGTVIKNSLGTLVANATVVPTKIPGYQSMRMIVNVTDYGLTYGSNYDVTLYTTNGEYLSGSFIIPENVRISEFSFDNNALILTITSMASQTIVFDSATINEFIGIAGTHNSHTNVVAKDIPVSTKLPSNGNVTITIQLKTVLSPGNYSVSLHSNVVYVFGASKYFTISGPDSGPKATESIITKI
jgi:hypothetical protein